MIVIVVALLLVVGIVVGAVMYIKNQNNAGPRQGHTVSMGFENGGFENPMYDTQGAPKQNPIAGQGFNQQQQQQQGGGMQGGGIYAEPLPGGTYAEPFQGGGQSSNSGYMDVAPANGEDV